MTNIWEKAISILAGNLNSGHSYLITAVTYVMQDKTWFSRNQENYRTFSQLKLGLILQGWCQKFWPQSWNFTTNLFLLKFLYSERPHKFDKISQLIWILLSKRQIKWDISSYLCGLFRIAIWSTYIIRKIIILWI